MNRKNNECETILVLSYIVLLHKFTIGLQVMFLRTIKVNLSGIKARPQTKKKREKIFLV